MGVPFQETNWIVESDAKAIVQAIHNPAPFLIDDPIAEKIMLPCAQTWTKECKLDCTYTSSSVYAN